MSHLSAQGRTGRRTPIPKPLPRPKAGRYFFTDDAGSLYIGDVYRVRKVTPDGIIHTIAGSGTGGYDGDGVPATAAKIYSATGVTVDHAGNLYIADAQNQRVRKVTPDGIIRTVAGNGTAGTLLGRAATRHCRS